MSFETERNHPVKKMIDEILIELEGLREKVKQMDNIIYLYNRAIETNDELEEQIEKMKNHHNCANNECVCWSSQLDAHCSDWTLK